MGVIVYATAHECSVLIETIAMLVTAIRVVGFILYSPSDSMS